ncbi:MAG: ATP-binding protein [Salinivirgaceae bacterium]|nr:ATP-binding protein [Salinivirgaceae bacterium]
MEKDITNEVALKNSIFRIGYVFSVDGREVRIKVDKSKNASHLLFQGELIKNVSVGSYLKVNKGYISIIGKVEGEFVKEDRSLNDEYSKEENKIDRILIIKLLGYIESGKFERGIKELPLIGNECYLIDKSEFESIHAFVKENDISLKIGTLNLEPSQDIKVGINGLFASHLGIFGNTGSGKSYTLAKVYRELFLKASELSSFKSNAKFLLFDFNGEYNNADAIISNKKVYNLSTQKSKDKIPFVEKDILNVELISIMANATEKTQQPFIKRAISYYKNVYNGDSNLEYFKNILKSRLIAIYQMSDKVKCDLLLDYLINILPQKIDDKGISESLKSDVGWHGEKKGYYLNPWEHPYNIFSQDESKIKDTLLYSQIDLFEFSENLIERLIAFLHLQLIEDVLGNRAQNEHIAPAINKLKSFKKDFEKIIETESGCDFWHDYNLVVINLNETNIAMKKMIPLLLSHKVYSEHKSHKKEGKSLNIIIDEAHNILSYTSQRESETWKDYRLETFEEIIKEGRKFGVFLTIASQRPSDISSTIISQLHNYFIHRLINDKDLQMVECTISYLDKTSAEMLPILPTGACVMAGQLATIPVVVKIDAFSSKANEPDNKTFELVNIWQKERVEHEILVEPKLN